MKKKLLTLAVGLILLGSACTDFLEPDSISTFDTN